jgi:hypothetical protein
MADSRQSCAELRLIEDAAVVQCGHDGEALIIREGWGWSDEWL